MKHAWSILRSEPWSSLRRIRMGAGAGAGERVLARGCWREGAGERVLARGCWRESACARKYEAPCGASLGPDISPQKLEGASVLF